MARFVVVYFYQFLGFVKVKFDWTIFWLAIISFVVTVVSWLKLVDDDSMKGRSKGYLIRKGIIGTIGNIIIVLGTFYTAQHFGISEAPSLVASSAIGYIGSDVIFRKIEKAVEIWLEKKANK